MKNLIKFLPIAILTVACSSQTGNIDALKTKRDSLQQSVFDTQKEINKLNLEIAKLDTAISADDLKTKKMIIIQKNKMAVIEQKIAELENTLSKKDEARLLTVSVKEVASETFNHYFTVFGNVEADKYGMITPEMTGKVQTIYVAEGQTVEKGTLLLSLNTEALENQIKSVKSNLDLAVTTFEKQKTLWDQKIGSEIQYLQAKSTKESIEAQLEALESQLRMSQLRAPYNGTVNHIYPKKGEMAGPGIPVVEFVNLAQITVKANVSEKYLNKVKKGEMVTLRFETLPDVKINTPIERISQVIDAKSRTFEIELKVTNPNNQIKPNMVSSILINDFTSAEAFVVPSLAIRRDINGSFIYLAKEQDNQHIVTKQRIETGLSYSDETMVTKGLNAGDKVITKGYNMVSNGVPVKIQ